MFKSLFLILVAISSILSAEIETITLNNGKILKGLVENQGEKLKVTLYKGDRPIGATFVKVDDIQKREIPENNDPLGNLLEANTEKWQRVLGEYENYSQELVKVEQAILENQLKLDDLEDKIIEAETKLIEELYASNKTEWLALLKKLSQKNDWVVPDVKKLLVMGDEYLEHYNSIKSFCYCLNRPKQNYNTYITILLANRYYENPEFEKNISYNPGSVPNFYYLVLIDPSMFESINGPEEYYEDQLKMLQYTLGQKELEKEASERLRKQKKAQRIAERNERISKSRKKVTYKKVSLGSFFPKKQKRK